MREQGSVLLPAALLMFLFAGIAVGAAVVIRMEVLVQDRFGRAAEGFYAAEAGLASALAELSGLPSWTPVLDGSRRSALSQGPLSGEQVVPGGSVLVCCGAGSATDRLARETLASALRARRLLRWQPFLWTPLAALTSAEAQRGVFVVVWVADDETDGDGDVAADSNGVVIVRSEALHPGGLRRAVEAYVSSQAPSPGDGPEGEGGPAPDPFPGVVSWREVR